MLKKEQHYGDMEECTMPKDTKIAMIEKSEEKEEGSNREIRGQ